MDMLALLAASLGSPMVLAFGLGLVAALARSDLRFPEPLVSALGIYLLFAIGLKGGARLEGVGLETVWKPMLAGIVLCLAIPVWVYALLRRFVGLSAVDAAAIAAHYGSVSAVTFGATSAFLDGRGASQEGFLPALLAVMEVPAILVSVWLLRRSGEDGVAPGGGTRLWHELLTGKGVVLLVGGMVIGLAGGKQGFSQVAPLFEAPFFGVLTLFLLDVGLVAGKRLSEFRAAGLRLAAFAVVLPLVHGCLGVMLGRLSGLGVGGCTLLAALAASASYIAAPAAVRVAMPAANPALYVTTSLAITFPMNLVIGIPLYYSFARWMAL